MQPTLTQLRPLLLQSLRREPCRLIAIVEAERMCRADVRVVIEQGRPDVQEVQDVVGRLLPVLLYVGELLGVGGEHHAVPEKSKAVKIGGCGGG